LIRLVHDSLFRYCSTRLTAGWCPLLWEGGAAMLPPIPSITDFYPLNVRASRGSPLGLLLFLGGWFLFFFDGILEVLDTFP
jgi:hypothetical protein